MNYIENLYKAATPREWLPDLYDIRDTITDRSVMIVDQTILLKNVFYHQ
ncbi:Uncharacterised protein [Chryseobacterium nakagawai]|nr:Uncharacterised protein [Chryseobacterium nakagawai]